MKQMPRVLNWTGKNIVMKNEGDLDKYLKDALGDEPIEVVILNRAYAQDLLNHFNWNRAA